MSYHIFGCTTCKINWIVVISSGRIIGRKCGHNKTHVRRF